MKKVLLGTTALIGAALAAVPAQAQLEVTVGGYTSFQAGYFDNDDATSTERDFQTEAQVSLNADGVADNGLQYGARVLLDASTSDASNADETNVYLAGSWGRVEMGDEDGASELGVTAPTVGIGQINGSVDDFITPLDRALVLQDRGDATFKPLDTDDSTKVTYYTPNFAGFQGGVSYVPENSGIASTNGGVNLDDGENIAFSNDGNVFEDVWETALRYTGEYRGVGMTIGGQYNFGEGVDGNEDLSAWGVGAKFAFGGFTLGGGYTDNGDSSSTDGAGDDESESWNAGVTYEQGPWGVGVSYLSVDFDTAGDSTGVIGSDGAGGDFDMYAVGGTYTVAPGLTTGIDAAYYERDRDVGAETEGYVIMADVTAAF